MENMKAKAFALLAVITAVLIAGAAYLTVTGTTLVPRAASAAPLFSEEAVTAIYENASPAVVEVRVAERTGGLPGAFFQQGQGSGFIIDGDGHILTNYHVVDSASSVEVVLEDGKTLDAQVVGTDTIDDLALLKVDGSAVSGITPLQLGDSSTVKPGQMAIALGSPFGLDDSITVGVISGINRALGGSGLTGLIQTDAAINPGNSGGPLLNSRGEVIGINTAIESPATGARGIGFAVPSNTIQNVMPSMLEGQQLKRPWLGISGMSITPALAKALGLSVEQGVYVVGVVSDGPAVAAGLKGGTGSGGAPASGGDVITAVDGRSVRDMDGLAGYLKTRKVGDSVSLTVLRDGNSTDIQVTLGAWPDRISLNPAPRTSPLPGIPWPRGRGFLPIPGHGS